MLFISISRTHSRNSPFIWAYSFHTVSYYLFEDLGPKGGSAEGWPIESFAVKLFLDRINFRFSDLISANLLGYI